MIFRKEFFIRVITLLLMLTFVISTQYSIQIKAQQSFVEDESHYLTGEQKDLLENKIGLLPEKYHITFLPKIDSAIDIKAKELFAEKQLTENTILILVSVESREVSIVTGEALQKKGLNDPFFQKEMEQYFVPSVKTTGIDQALIQLVQGISKDVAIGLKETDKSKKDTPKIPESPQSSIQTSSSRISNSEYLLLVSLVVSVGVIFYLNKRKKRSS